MGCILGKSCDPSAPDSSVRHTWHVDGLIVEDGNLVEKKRGGLVYVLNEAVCYKPRRLDCTKTGGSMKMDIAGIQNITRVKEYETKANSPKSTSKTDVVLLEMHENNMHKSVGLLSKNTERLHTEISEIISKHRQKPKIMQYNSIDIDGVEIDVPN